MPSVPTHMVEVYKAAWTRAEGSEDFTDGVFFDVLASSNAAAASSERDKFETARDPTSACGVSRSRPTDCRSI
jgi:hypothetical protein